MRTLSCLLLLPVIARAALVTNEDDFTSIPDGVTMCDGSIPVGLIQAYLLTQPLHYCMNHGLCKDDYALQTAEPCQCPDGYQGPHCEFPTDQKMPDCTLKCYAGGTCQVGAKSFELLESSWTSLDDFQYCICPDGFQGVHCEQQVESCGDSHCLHGGTCTSISGLDGQYSNYCDCTTADDGAFAGRFCNHKATVFCAQDDPSGHAFCTNGGTCKGGSELGCDCPDGFIGPVCEFKNEQLDYSECKLECFNGGICRKGAKDISFLAKFGIHRHLTIERFNEDFEHCVCPNGLVGLQCEYQMDVCPGREVACMHGGVCKIVTDGEDTIEGMACDCGTAQKELIRYAGDYCEVKSTEFCTIDGLKTSDGDNFDAFCTQGGQCRDHVPNGDQHPGCTCPGGTSGAHCEVGEPSMAKTGSNTVVRGILLAFGLVAVACIAFIGCRRRRRFCNRANRRARGIVEPFKDSPPPPTLDHINNINSWMRSNGSERDYGRREEEGQFVNDNASVSSLGFSDSSRFEVAHGACDPPRPASNVKLPIRVMTSGGNNATFGEGHNGTAMLMKPRSIILSSSNAACIHMESAYIAPTHTIS